MADDRVGGVGTYADGDPTCGGLSGRPIVGVLINCPDCSPEEYEPVINPFNDGICW